MLYDQLHVGGTYPRDGIRIVQFECIYRRLQNHGIDFEWSFMMSDKGLFVPALEKGVYSTFRQAEVSYRQGQIGNKLIDFNHLQLPNNSCLHICNNYLESPVTTILPNMEDPFIKNEQFHLLMDFVMTMPGHDDPLFPITDKFRYRPYGYNTDIRKFYTAHKNLKRFTTRESALHQSNALPILNYNIISTAVVTGTFVYYRKFDILLRTILSNIASIEGKHQYLQLELSRTLYRKVQFQQTFDKINYQTIRIKNDPSFYFLIHLINFLSKTATTSLFSKLTQVQLDQLNIILTAGDKAIIYNMGDLKAILDSRNDDNFYQMVIRHITALKLAGYADMDISEMDDHEVDKLVDDIAPPETTQPDEPVPEHSETDRNATHNITGPGANNVPNPKSRVVDHGKNVTPEAPHTTETGGAPSVLPKPTKSENGATKTTAGADKKPVSTTIITKVETPATSPVLKPYDTSRPTSVIDHASYNRIMSDATLTDDQKTRALKVAQAYKTLLVDGRNIEELLDQTAEPDITKGHLDFLKNKVDDPSMLNSTAIDLDRHYVQQMMAKDLAAIAATMATNGMFLVDVYQKDEVTSLDRIRMYKLTYEDAHGRRHRVVFKLPIVSPDGTILVNGIESRMVKQQVNLPICKIDTWRVSLSSNYNKTLVERIATKAHNYGSYITKYIAAVYKAKVGLELNYGHLVSEKKLPYDYTSVAARYSKLFFGGFIFTFDYASRLGLETPALEETHTAKQVWAEREKKYGVYCGTSAITEGGPLYMFFGYDNFVRAIDTKTDRIIWKRSFTDIVFSAFGTKVTVPKQLSEWTELKILDKNFPIVFILGFEYGLKRTLDHIKLDYKFYPIGERFDRDFTTIVVPFADGNLVFDRYPLEKSFVASGLLKFNMKPYEFAKFNTPDGYYTLLQDSGFSMNFLKGITSFFKLFVDPITRDVLIKMHEPTDVAGLLLRATQMLTTDDAIPTASMKNHRIRGYERFPAMLYNEMARSFATYENQRGNRKVFSINPEAVFLRIIQDQSLHIVDEINPMENVKDKHSVTYAGSGGRTAQSFVIEDRQYPKDGVGILSECTPDSGKVAINAYVTANPVIENIRGMFDVDKIEQDKLEPSQILSTTAMLMPCSTNDD